MPDTEASKDSPKRSAIRRSVIGRKLAAKHAAIRHKLARWIVRRRSFWLYLLARTWPFPPLLWLAMQAPLRAPESPRVSLTLKVLICILVGVSWFDACVQAERRWKRLRH